MGDAQRWPGVCDCQLRSQSAGPEERQLPIGDMRRSNILIAALQVDANLPGISDVDGSAMNIGETRGDLDGAYGVRRAERTHGDDQLPSEFSSRGGVDVCLVYTGNIACIQEWQWDSCFLQRLFEREGTSQCECHQVVSPILMYVRYLIRQLSIHEYLVARHCVANINILPKPGQQRLPRVSHGKERASRLIALAVQ